MADTMRELIARAICDTAGYDWDDLTAEAFLEQADAALAAMTEPSEAMVDAGREWIDWCGRHDETPEPESGWRNMIHAAHNEEASGDSSS